MDAYATINDTQEISRKTSYLLGNIHTGIGEIVGMGYHVDDMQMMQNHPYSTRARLEVIAITPKWVDKLVKPPNTTHHNTKQEKKKKKEHRNGKKAQ